MSLESDSDMDRLEFLHEKVRLAKELLTHWENAVTKEVIIRAGNQYDNCKKKLAATD